MMGTLVVETVWNGETVILEIGTGFTEQDRKEVWANQEDWVGQTVKYKFQRHGSMDKPRLPVYLGVRDSRDIS